MLLHVSYLYIPAKIGLKDVYGDDCFTVDKEPSTPAELEALREQVLKRCSVQPASPPIILGWEVMAA